ncbi:MAG: fibronectin type III domain-containing protein [Acidobacteriota bacterium]
MTRHALPSAPSATRSVGAAAVAAALLLWALHAPAASGAAYVGLADAALADGADAIVVGTVEGRWTSVENGVPHTHHRLSVERWLRSDGSRGGVTVSWPGGVRSDGVALRLSSSPNLTPGQRVLLFLDRDPDGGHRLHQWTLGAFRLTADGEGKTLALRDPSELQRIVPQGSTPPRDGPRDADLFIAWLEARSRGRALAVDYFVPPASIEPPVDIGPMGTAEPRDGAGEPQGRFTLALSPTEPFPLGCGENGGNPLRNFDFDVGSAVFWRAHFVGLAPLAEGGIDALRHALAAWSGDPFSAVQLRFTGLTASELGLIDNDGINTFLFSDPNEQIPGRFDGTGILAVAAPWFTCSTVTWEGTKVHPILEGDVVLQDGLEDFFAVVPTPEQVAQQLFGHQIGHTLGFTFSDDPDALMAPQLHPDLRGAALAVDDLAALGHLYGLEAPPAAATPGGFTARHLPGVGVELDWLPAGGASNYRIDRAVGDGPFEVRAAVSAPGNSFVDDLVEPAVEYRYRLRSQNATGASAVTETLTVETPSLLAPESPNHLRGAALDDRRIRLSWQDNACDEDEIRLQILQDGAYVEVPFALPPDTRSVLISGLEPATSYSFRVLARNAFGDSEPSAVAKARTFQANPPCEVLSDQLCLWDGRFALKATYLVPGTQSPVVAKTVPNTDGSGFFWFFNSRNLELLVDLVDGADDNGHFQLRAVALSDLPYTLEVTDTQTGLTRTYERTADGLCGIDDPRAFPSTPPIQSSGRRLGSPVVDPRTLHLEVQPVLGDPRELPAACATDPTTLPLVDGRFRLDLQFQDEDGSERQAEAVDLTSTSGLFQKQGGGTERADWAIKILDGRPVNNNFWLFYGPLSGVESWLTVEDTFTGQRRVYYNPPGESCALRDTNSFPD